MQLTSDIRSLGHDILWCSSPADAADALRGRTRFLDKLWLPCDLAQLSEPQILVINRYREGAIASDGQYGFARNARMIMHRIVTRLRSRRVIEIGSGKFPLEVSAPEYLGVDIDPEALLFLKAQGLPCCAPGDLRSSATSLADLIVSVYAMHFAVSDQLIEDLGNVTTPEAIFCFNLIVEDAVNPVNLLARLGTDWPFVQVVKTQSMARREYFFLCGRAFSHFRLNDAAAAIREAM